MTTKTDETKIEEPKIEEPKKNPADDYKKDMFKFKEELKAEREEKEKLTQKLKEIEEKSLQEKSNFKELYEREKTKRTELEQDIQKKNEAFYKTLKHSTIKEFARKMGVLDEAVDDLDLIDTSSVEIETTSLGKLNVIGAQELVEDLKTKKPHWFREGKINFNNGNPDYKKPKELTGKDLLDLQKKDPLKYKEYISKKLTKK